MKNSKKKLIEVDDEEKAAVAALVDDDDDDNSSATDDGGDADKDITQRNQKSDEEDDKKSRHHSRHHHRHRAHDDAKSTDTNANLATSSSTVIEIAETDDYYGNIRLQERDVLSEDSDSIISFKNVHKTYLLGVEGIPAVRGVSLTVRRGEFLVIFGTSGGGKTTMLNLIGTIDKPTKGDMWLCGQRITERTKDSALAALRLHKLGFVFQTFNLLSSLTALENVEMPMILAGRLSPAERRRRARALLSEVGLSARLRHYPSQLSGGEQQRVTIARAIANEPELLLLDEPTGDLDTENGAIVMNLLCNLHESKGITLVMVTHDVHLKAFADRVIWMRDGKIQRIEKTLAAAKAEARQRLRATLAAVAAKRERKAKARADEAAAAADAVDAVEGSDAAVAAAAAAAAPAIRVEIRRPESYETHPNYNGTATTNH